MQPERSLDNLIWIDLEFTNLDPTIGSIMQAAMIVTRADLSPVPPPGIPPKVGGLLFDVHIDAAQAETASPWVREHQAEQLRRSQGSEAVPLATVEELFVGYLLTSCEVPDPVQLRPLIAGNSVHGDHAYVKRHMPRLAELISFRQLDVTTLKELTRRWAPGLEFTKNPGTIQRWYPGDVEVKGQAHDALFDIKGSIAELNFYRQHLFVSKARGPRADAPAQA